MRILLLSVLFCLCAISIQAQGRANRAERIKAFRVATFTEVLDLTPSEAEVFWPLYNEMEAKRELIKKTYKPNRNIDELSDKEIEIQIERYLEREQKELDLKMEYVQKFKTVLPLRKVAKLPMAEKRFRQRLVKQMARRKQQRD